LNHNPDGRKYPFVPLFGAKDMASQQEFHLKKAFGLVHK